MLVSFIQYKKTIFSIALLCACYAPVFSQNKLIDSLLHWVETHPKIDSQYILTLHRLSFRYSETDIDKSFAYFEKTAYLSDSLNFTTGKALAQINLGILLSSSANYEGSNDAYFKAIDYAEKSGFLRLKSVSFNDIADNFLALKDYEKCRQYTNDAIEINKRLNQTRSIAINYELLGRCNIEEKKYSDALDNIKKGLAYGEKLNDPYVLSQLFNGLGKLYAVYGNTDAAQNYFAKALAMAIKDDALRNEHLVYMAKVKYLKTLPISQKLTSLYAALAIAKKTSYLEGIGDAAKELSNTYDLLNKKDSSIHYYRLYRSSSDSLFSENNKRNVIIKESEWRIKKADIENGHLKELSEIQQKELNFKNALLLSSIIALLLGVAVTFLVYKNYQHKKNQAITLQKQKETELSYQLSEMEFKAFKAQLNPHFIFNYLNSISGYILQSQPEKASNMIIRFSKMLRNVLTNSELNMVPLVDDIKTILQYLELMHEIATPTFECQVSISEAIKIMGLMVPPLFIQPYVENAILHGLKNAEGKNLLLQINYDQVGQALQIQIIDNGTGFDQKDALRKKIMQSQNGEIHLGLGLTERRIKGFCERNGYKSSIKFSAPYEDVAQPGTQVTILIDGIFENHQSN